MRYRGIESYHNPLHRGVFSNFLSSRFFVQKMKNCRKRDWTIWFLYLRPSKVWINDIVCHEDAKQLAQQRHMKVQWTFFDLLLTLLLTNDSCDVLLVQRSVEISLKRWCYWRNSDGLDFKWCSIVKLNKTTICGQKSKWIQVLIIPRHVICR